jgi:hypothetical protein
MARFVCVETSRNSSALLNVTELVFCSCESCRVRKHSAVPQYTATIVPIVLLMRTSPN